MFADVEFYSTVLASGGIMKRFLLWSIVAAFCMGAAFNASAYPVRQPLKGMVVVGENDSDLQAIVVSSIEIDKGLPNVGWIAVSKDDKADEPKLFTLFFSRVDCPKRQSTVTGAIRVNEAGEQVKSFPIPVGADGQLSESFQPFADWEMALPYFCDVMGGKIPEKPENPGGLKNVAAWVSDLRKQWQTEQE